MERPGEVVFGCSSSPLERPGEVALWIFFITFMLIMKGVCHISTVALAILLGFATTYAQTAKYDVFFMGKKIGETTVQMKDSVGFKLYSLHNISRFKFLFWDKKINMSGHVVVDRNGLMTIATFESIRENGNYVTRTTCDKDKLTIDKNGEIRVISGAVRFPSILLYFFEPRDLQKFFYEPKGTFIEVKKEAEGLYTTELNNHSDKYTYRSGKLILVEMKNSLGSIFMKLVN